MGRGGRWLDGIFPARPLGARLEMAFLGLYHITNLLGFQPRCSQFLFFPPHTAEHPNSKSDGYTILRSTSVLPGSGTVSWRAILEGMAAFSWTHGTASTWKGRGAFFGMTGSWDTYIAHDNGGVGKGIRCLHNRETSLALASFRSNDNRPRNAPRDRRMANHHQSSGM